ncbi:MAG: TfuA-like protein [Cyanobacteriota bacterium]
MTQVVFVGPSLPEREVRSLHPEVVIQPPVRQGDIVSVLRAYRPSAIGIIDGVFLNVLSVWHKELLLALDEGVALYGAASMGALRAAECAPFGMVGLGRIYARFADGTLSRDDEVAVAHATAEFGHRSLSEPLVNLRFNLEDAVTAGVIDADLAAALIDEAAAVYFPDRCWPRLLASSLLTHTQRSGLEAHLREHAIDHKAADARLLLRTMASLVTDSTDSTDNGPSPAPTPALAPWSLEDTHYLQALVERDRWTMRQGEAISQEAIARHALVNDPRAPELVRRSLVDLLALVAARHLGLEAEKAELRQWRASFMAERGLATEEDLARFYADNDLTEAEGDQLLADRATLDKAVEWLRLTRFKLGVVRPLLDSYRHQGEYPARADAAAATQQHCGRGADGLPPMVPLPPLSTAEQIARHGRETGWPVPKDLLAWSQRHGFQHPNALLMEIERSRQARTQGLASRPLTLEGGGAGESHGHGS